MTRATAQGRKPKLQLDEWPKLRIKEETWAPAQGRNPSSDKTQSPNSSSTSDPSFGWRKKNPSFYSR